LLAHGANPNARVAKQPSRFGFSLFQLRLVGATPYLLAAMGGDAAVMRALIAAGADPALPTNEKTSALMVASGLGRVVGESRVSEPDSLAAVMLALELGGDVNAANAAGETALHGAAYIGANSIVELLIDKGAAVNPANKCGWTPLTIAEGVYHQGVVIVHEPTATLLRSHGGSSADVARGRTGTTTGASRC
jgi:ankyrin repeat protein